MTDKMQTEFERVSDEVLAAMVAVVGQQAGPGRDQVYSALRELQERRAEWEDTTIGVEEGNVCLRNETGWLLCMASEDWPLEKFLEEARNNQRAWEKMRDR